MVPNFSWKIISGWIMISEKVIIYDMSENKMGYRGSKSFLNNQKIIIIIQSLKSYKNVKEQRVDGN